MEERDELVELCAEEQTDNRRLRRENEQLKIKADALLNVTEAQIRAGLKSLNQGQIDIIKLGIEQHGCIGHYGTNFITTAILKA